MVTRTDMEDFAEFGTKLIGFGRSYAYSLPDRNPDDPLPEPFLFLKPWSSTIPSGDSVWVPRGGEIVHEVELGVVIGKVGRDIPLSKAEDYVAGYTLALDLCEKVSQVQATKEGRSWAISKGMDGMAPLGRFISKKEIEDIAGVQIKLNIDGAPRQHGHLSELIYTIPQLVAYTSGIFTLQPGDVLLTGSPANVSTVKIGQKMTATLEYEGKLLDTLEVDVKEKETGFRIGGDSWLEDLPK